MKTDELEYLRERIRELAAECTDPDLLDLVCRVLVQSGSA